MDFLFFSIYLFLLTWLVTKTPFFKKLPVPVWVLAALFLVKITAGIYYGWFFTHMPDYKMQADTWRMYNESLIETELLKKDPASFLLDLFSPRYQQSSGGILASSHSYWNDIKSVLVVKLMALCNLLTGGRYYTNVVFFEYFSFFGPVALCRLFIYYFPQKKWYLVGGAFMFPSTLLWCSGIHKEGLLLTSLAMATWFIHQTLLQRTRLFSAVLSVSFHLLLLFLLRNYLALFFVLWCIPWVLAYRLPAYKWLLFPAAGVLYICFFFFTAYSSFLPNLPARLASRQHEFLEIPGESLVQPKPLGGDFGSYANVFPEAVVNGFFQPLPSKFKKTSYLPAAAEIIFFCMLLINTLYYLVKRKTRITSQLQKGASAFALFCCFLGLAVFVVIGYIIPYLGAIVRYKAVVWPFIILPLIAISTSLDISIKKKNME